MIMMIDEYIIVEVDDLQTESKNFEFDQNSLNASFESFVIEFIL